MIRSILAVIAGVIVGGLTVGLIELPGMFLHPLPKDFDFKNSAAMNAHFVNAPVALKVLVLAAWAIGPFVAAFVACWIARRTYVTHALVVGIIFMLLDLANLFQFAHPWWMWLGGIVAPPITAWLGGRTARRLFGTVPANVRPYDMREKNMAC
jgi:hypothetical protein